MTAVRFTGEEGREECPRFFPAGLSSLKNSALTMQSFAPMLALFFFLGVCLLHEPQNHQNSCTLVLSPPKPLQLHGIGGVASHRLGQRNLELHTPAPTG